MKRFFTAITMILCAAMLFGSVPMASAESIPAVTTAPPETEAEKIDKNAAAIERIYKGSFYYSSFESSDGVAADYYYSDSYFIPSGKLNNEHLRTMSAVIAFGVSPYSQEAHPAQGITQIFTDTGFDADSIDIREMDVTTKDTIGTVIAHKTINGVPLIAVAVRGNGYDEEWASNVTAGSSGDPIGFAVAADKVINRIEQYMQKYQLQSPKFWVAGYSRAGSVTNLIGRRLNENADTYGTTADDIYVYTFEAANSSADDTVYGNIHHIVDKNDLVPYVYPAEWGIGLNGVKEYIGGKDEVITSKTFDIRAKDFSTDSKQVTKAAFLSSFSSFLGENLKRDTYCEVLQEPLAGLCEIVYSKPAKDQDAFFKYMSQVFESTKSDARMALVLVSVVTMPEADSTASSLTNLICKHMDDEKGSFPSSFSDEEYAFVKNAVDPMVRVMLKLVKPELSYTEQDANGKTIRMPLYHLLTFMDNSESLLSAHYNTHLFQELTALDSYYSADFTIPAGKLLCGKEYTYAEFGDSLFTEAEKMGFSERDIRYLKNGYDVSIVNEVQPVRTGSVPEEDRASVERILGKSAKQDGYYHITPYKQVGFRKEPAKTEFKDNTVVIALSEPPAENERMAALLADGGDTAVMNSHTDPQDGRMTLTFQAPKEGIYAVARSTQLLSLPAEGKPAKERPVTWVIVVICTLIFFFAAFVFFRVTGSKSREVSVPAKPRFKLREKTKRQKDDSHKEKTIRIKKKEK